MVFRVLMDFDMEHKREDSPMPTEYVRKIDGTYKIANTRATLDSLVYLFREGLSAENMVDTYLALTLEQVYGALAFYLGNQKEVDAYLAEGRLVAQLQQDRWRKTDFEVVATLPYAAHATHVAG